MAKVKLELQDKTDEELRAFAANHARAIFDNQNFPNPDPPVADFDPALQAFTEKLEEITAEEIKLQALRAKRDELRVVLDLKLKGRGSYVEKQSLGEEAKILSAGFQVQATGTATTSLPAPTQVVASMGDEPGEIDVSCHAVPRARTYVVELREHTANAAPGVWRQARLSSRSSTSVTGLVSGQRYSFRLRALGPNDVESPWSEEAGCMAP